MTTIKRLRIMQATEALFSTGRVDEITMDDVARKAGVGKGTLYRYFKDKDDLFFEVALSGYEELCERVGTARERSSDFRTCLVQVCRQLATFHESRRKLMHMIQAEERRALGSRGERRNAWLKKRQQMVAAVATLLEEGCREGVVRTDLPCQVLAVFFLGILRTRSREGRLDPKTRIDNEAVVDLFLRGAGQGDVLCGESKQ